MLPRHPDGAVLPQVAIDLAAAVVVNVKRAHRRSIGEFRDRATRHRERKNENYECSMTKRQQVAAEQTGQHANSPSTIRSIRSRAGKQIEEETEIGPYTLIFVWKNRDGMSRPAIEV
jgi:hypothetical protein